jgi:hypothetical protein
VETLARPRAALTARSRRAEEASRRQRRHGLYDTSLAAIRTLQDDYEARAINSVICWERRDDGRAASRSSRQTIERERDPARPIQVIAIGMGPDADAKALRRIAAATGGRSYVARNPEDIAEVFIDAMLAR